MLCVYDSKFESACEVGASNFVEAIVEGSVKTGSIDEVFFDIGRNEPSQMPGKPLNRSPVFHWRRNAKGFWSMAPFTPSMFRRTAITALEIDMILMLLAGCSWGHVLKTGSFRSIS